MSFDVRNLSVLAYANGFTMWHYRGDAEDEEKVTERDFFAPAQDMLAQGDLLIASTRRGPVLMAMHCANGQVQAARCGN